MDRVRQRKQMEQVAKFESRFIKLDQDVGEAEREVGEVVDVVDREEVVVKRAGRGLIR